MQKDNTLQCLITSLILLQLLLLTCMCQQMTVPFPSILLTKKDKSINLNVAFMCAPKSTKTLHAYRNKQTLKKDLDR